MERSWLIESKELRENAGRGNCSDACWWTDRDPGRGKAKAVVMNACTGDVCVTGFVQNMPALRVWIRSDIEENEK